jgi:hypothetical protein
MMAVALTLLGLGCSDRHLYLYDTFEGMTKPTSEDISYKGEKAIKKFEQTRISDTSSTWNKASIDEARKNLSRTGYEMSRIHFVKGPVEETIPEKAPTQIALLHLDTDWYTSTKHELTYLYPRLSFGGVIIIDDYGHWKGARKAMNEFIAENNIGLLLNRIDYTVRIGVKTQPLPSQ